MSASSSSSSRSSSSSSSGSSSSSSIYIHEIEVDYTIHACGYAQRLGKIPDIYYDLSRLLFVGVSDSYYINGELKKSTYYDPNIFWTFENLDNKDPMRDEWTSHQFDLRTVQSFEKGDYWSKTRLLKDTEVSENYESDFVPFSVDDGSDKPEISKETIQLVKVISKLMSQVSGVGGYQVVEGNGSIPVKPDIYCRSFGRPYSRLYQIYDKENDRQLCINVIDYDCESG